jgi:TrmH family RNA methyltransferase
MSQPDPKLLDSVRIVLSRTSHPGNIGAAARAMKTMGLSQLVLVSPAVFPNSQADAMASGAADVLANARVCDTLAEALAGATLALGVSARRRDITAEVLTPREAAPRLLAEAQAAGVALVFGNETSGLSNEAAAPVCAHPTGQGGSQYPARNSDRCKRSRASQSQIARQSGTSGAEQKIVD